MFFSIVSSDPALIVGGVVVDWIKGPLPGSLPPDLARGASLNRAIDHHVESHPAFQASRFRVSPGRRRYAGVLVNFYYDHLLADPAGFTEDFTAWLADAQLFARLWQSEHASASPANQN
jgi:acyl carrier protein phosphodiesterase